MKIPVCAVICLLLAGCASGGAFDGVTVAVAPEGAGAARHVIRKWQLVELVEIDGSVATLSWPEGTNADALWQLDYCLGHSRVARSGAPPDWSDPGLVHAEAYRCVGESRLPPPVEEAWPSAAVFDVWLRAESARTNTAAGGGNPIRAWGGRVPGQQLLVRKTGPSSLEEVREDALKCRDTAISKGEVVRTYQTPPPGWDGMYIGTSFASIEPLVERFDACLRGSGYELKAP